MTRIPPELMLSSRESSDRTLMQSSELSSTRWLNSSAARRASSARLAWVTSVDTPTRPTTAPLSSRIGDLVDRQIRVSPSGLVRGSSLTRVAPDSITA
jgi:hypothetical protein